MNRGRSKAGKTFGCVQHALLSLSGFPQTAPRIYDRPACRKRLCRKVEPVSLSTRRTNYESATEDLQGGKRWRRKCGIFPLFRQESPSLLDSRLAPRLCTKTTKAAPVSRSGLNSGAEARRLDGCVSHATLLARSRRRRTIQPSHPHGVKEPAQPPDLGRQSVAPRLDGDVVGVERGFRIDRPGRQDRLRLNYQIRTRREGGCSPGGATARKRDGCGEH